MAVCVAGSSWLSLAAVKSFRMLICLLDLQGNELQSGNEEMVQWLRANSREFGLCPKQLNGVSRDYRQL